MSLNISNPETLDLIMCRRSVVARNMVPPGPDAEALQKILTAGMRVPDHGKLAPWRFLVFQGAARARFGDLIADAYTEETGQTSGPTLKGLRGFPAQAPVLVTVASVPSDAKPIPDWEQRLSAGAVCQTLLIAAHALGYVGQWLTGWAAYSDGVHRRLELPEGARIAGFLFFGSQGEAPAERARPAFDDIVTHWPED
ncbi:MAG: nitroreductase [Sphingomonadales bacterium]|nr:nitroreductase [Sphingomonadales bacterium]